MKTFIHLLKREVLEHKKSVFYQFLMIAAILLVTVTLAAVFASSGHEASEVKNVNFKAIKFTEGFFWSIGNLFYLLMFLTALRYLTVSLHKEREDKSVLFWKSMPVSDTQTVLSKLFTGAIIIPAVAIGIFILLHFVMLIVFSILNIGKIPVHILWTDTHILQLWFMLISSIITQALWAAPLYGIVLIYSAYQKDYGHGLIISIIVASILEKIITYIVLPHSTSFLFNEIMKRLVGSVLPWVVPYFKNPETFDYKQVTPFGGKMQLDYSLTLPVSNPELWFGIVFAAACIAITIYIRNRRT